MEGEKKCKDLVRTHLRSRINELRDLWTKYHTGSDDASEDMCNYGLSFDYVEAGTFEDQEQGYFRYQISCGGPSDEYRFYVGMDHKPARIEYWYMDWFDGAKVTLGGNDFKLLAEILDWFDECGTLQSKMDEAVAA